MDTLEEIKRFNEFHDSYKKFINSYYDFVRELYKNEDGVFRWGGSGWVTVTNERDESFGNWYHIEDCLGSLKDSIPKRIRLINENDIQSMTREEKEDLFRYVPKEISTDIIVK